MVGPAQRQAGEKILALELATIGTEVEAGRVGHEHAHRAGALREPGKVPFRRHRATAVGQSRIGTGGRQGVPGHEAELGQAVGGDDQVGLAAGRRAGIGLLEDPARPGRHDGVAHGREFLQRSGRIPGHAAHTAAVAPGDRARDRAHDDVGEDHFAKPRGQLVDRHVETIAGTDDECAIRARTACRRLEHHLLAAREMGRPGLAHAPVARGDGGVLVDEVELARPAWTVGPERADPFAKHEVDDARPAPRVAPETHRCSDVEPGGLRSTLPPVPPMCLTDRRVAPLLSTDRRARLHIARTVVGLLAALACGSGISLRAQDEVGEVSIEGRPPNAAIVVGAANNMYPYSYEEDGRLLGFAVDLFEAVSREMGIKASRLPINNREAGEMLKVGRIDAILFLSETPERQKEMTMSTPLLTLQTVVVVRADEKRIRTLADLDGRIIATGSPGTVASTYVRDRVKGATEVYSTNPEEVLIQVSSGLADAGVLSRFTAAARIERLGLKNLRILDEGVEGYDVRYGFMVRRGDVRLLARLNEGITITHRDGTYARIYSTWFGRHEPRRLSRTQLIAPVATAGVLGLLALSVALVRHRRLSRRLATQESELATERALRSLVFDTHPSAALVLESDQAGKGLRLVSLNRAAARLFRLDPEVATGSALADLALPAEVADFFAEVSRRWPAEGGTAALEHRLADSRRRLATTLHPLASAPGDRRRLCVMATEAAPSPAIP